MLATKKFNLRRVSLTLNYLALLLSPLLYLDAVLSKSMGGPARVTVLDRAGVFNEEALRAFSPKLAENLRYNVGNWIMEPVRNEAINLALAIGVLAFLNVVGLHLVNPSKELSDSLNR